MAVHIWNLMVSITLLWNSLFDVQSDFSLIRKLVKHWRRIWGEAKSSSSLSGKGLCELKDSKASEISEPVSISAEFLLAQHQTSLKLVTKQQTNLLKPESFMGCVGNWPDR